jgi:hypothetical protein
VKAASGTLLGLATDVRSVNKTFGATKAA